MRRKYTILSSENRLRVAGLVSQYLKDFPTVQLSKVHRYVREHEGLEHVTYGHVKTIVKRITRYRRKYKLSKPRRRKVSEPLTTTTTVNGQQVWNWPGTGDETATLGSLRVTYTSPESTFDQGIRLIKAGLLLVEGGKGA